MKKLITILTVCVSFNLGIGQQKDSIDFQLHHQVDSLKRIVTDLKKEIINQEELKIYWQRDIDFIKKIETDNSKREARFITWMTIFLSIVTASIGVFSFLGFTNIRTHIKEAKERAKEFEIEQDQKVKVYVQKLQKEIHNEFADLKKENEKIIKRLFDTEKWSVDLKEKSNLIVINPESSKDDPDVLKVLGNFKRKSSKSKFSDIDKIKVAIERNCEQDKHNIVVLENSDGQWTLPLYKNDISEGTETATKQADVIVDLLDKYPNINIMYLGPGIFPSGNSTQKNRISYVNAPSKIYPNIMDTLKFMDILNPIAI